MYPRIFVLRTQYVVFNLVKRIVLVAEAYPLYVPGIAIVEIADTFGGVVKY